MDNASEVSTQRQHELQARIDLLDAALRGACDTDPPRFWNRRKQTTDAQRVQCAQWTAQSWLWHHLEWAYYSPCYDGPGVDCTRDIPAVEAMHGPFLNAVAATERATEHAAKAWEERRKACPWNGGAPETPSGR